MTSSVQYIALGKRAEGAITEALGSIAPERLGHARIEPSGAFEAGSFPSFVLTYTAGDSVLRGRERQRLHGDHADRRSASFEPE